MFGYEREEVLEQKADFLHPKDAAFQRMAEISTPIIQEKGHWSGEWEFQHRNGACFPAEVTLTTFLQTGTEDAYAVMVIRDITERKQAEAALQRRTTLVQLLQEIAVAANQATDINTALQFALTQICLQTKWAVGHVYFLFEATGYKLIPSQLWYLKDSQQFKKFQTATQKIRFKIGEGFPGLTAAKGEPTWIPDVSQERHFRRKKAAQAVGLQAAFAFPVTIENTVIAVLEFFATEAEDPDEPLLEVMANIGTQLSTVFERERARGELQRMSKVFMDAIDPILIEDLSGRIIGMNSEAERVYGWTRDELLGQPIQTIVPPERHKQAVDLLQRSKKGEQLRNIEGLRWDKAQEVTPILLTLFPLTDSVGKPDAIATIAKDISALKHAEEEVREKSALLQLLQEVATTANESQAIDSALQFTVKRVCTHTGWCIGHVYLPAESTPASLVSSSVWYLGNVKRFSSLRKHTEKRQAVPAGELAHRVLTTGEPKWVMDMTADPHFSRAKMAKRLGMKAALAFPILIENETVAVMEFFSSDTVEPDQSFLEIMANIGTQVGRVFERKRTEQQLSTSERLAALGVTAAKLAHEIGNPLNGMSTTVQLLERQIKNQAETRESYISEGLHDLAGEIQRLQALLDDLRAFVRPQQLCIQPTDLASLTTEMLAVVSDAYAEHGVRVKQSFPTDLPIVQADGKRLKQVVLNLCQNAMEAMPSGGRLTVTAGSSQKHIWLEVTDTGEGLPHSSGLDVFELFATTKSEGTGLGLAIVQQIIQAHNGTITYISQAGKGTTFLVRLPRNTTA